MTKVFGDSSLSVGNSSPCGRGLGCWFRAWRILHLESRQCLTVINDITKSLLTLFATIFSRPNHARLVDTVGRRVHRVLSFSIWCPWTVQADSGGSMPRLLFYMLNNDVDCNGMKEVILNLTLFYLSAKSRSCWTSGATLVRFPFPFPLSFRLLDIAAS